jgi:uncharacterized iron-regulated membrane protein
MATLASTAPAAQTAGKRLYAFYWRLHFYAGIFIAPFILWIALTALVYAASPQVEEVLYRDLYTVAVPAGASERPLDEQVAAARAAYPTLHVKSFLPATAPGRTAKVLLVPHGHHAGHGHGDPKAPDIAVWVNPYTAEVVGSMRDVERFQKVVGGLHGNMLQGGPIKPLTELASSWLVVLLLSGVVLWFPRKGGRLLKALVPRLHVKSRLVWRDFHSIVGLLFALAAILLALSGLMASPLAGTLFFGVKAALRQPMPTAGTFTSDASVGRAPLGLDEVAAIARASGIDVALTITPPADGLGAYRVTTNAPDQPQQYRVLFLDQYSGAVLKDVSWATTAPLSKLTLLGIWFHAGLLFGGLNQVVGGLTCLVVIFSVVSGYVMWWKRRPQGKLGAPARAEGGLGRLPKAALALMAVVALALPSLALSALVVLAVDAVVVRLARRARRPVAVPSAD